MIGALQRYVAENTDLKSSDGLVSRARNAGTVIAVVVIGIVALVGILIFGQVWEAMPLSENADDTETDPDPLFYEAEAVLEGFGDAMGLVPIILLVLLASVVIAVVQRMRA